MQSSEKPPVNTARIQEIKQAISEGRLSLRYILEKKGHVTGLAPNGMDALAQMRGSRPDLVLTDIVMPEMDGYELCHQIKSDTNLREVPVIMVTQLFDPVDVIRGLEAGADNFIIKPYEPQDIDARIQEVMTMPACDKTTCSPLEVRLSDGINPTVNWVVPVPVFGTSLTDTV